MEKLDKKNTAAVTALTPLQEGMLFHYRQAPRGEIYFEQLSLRIAGNIDVEIFREAWNFVIAANEMLRTVFRWQDVTNPVQVTLKEHRLDFTYNDYSKIPGENRQALLEQLKRADRKKGFDLTGVPFRVTLCKLGNDIYEMITSSHHILFDGWSNGIILKELLSAYNDLVEKKLPKKPAKTAFSTYVKWLQQRDFDGQAKFWQGYLAGFDKQMLLPIKAGKRDAGFIPGKYSASPGKDLGAMLGNMTGEYKLPFSAIIYGAWGILLQKYSNSRDVVFGVTVAGRSPGIPGIEEMVGLFIATLPLRIQADSREEAIDYLSRINEDSNILAAYETTSPVTIRENSPHSSAEEIFDTIMVIENYPIPTGQFAANSRLKIESYSMFEATNYDLAITIAPADKIEINFLYNSIHLEREAIARAARHFVAVLLEIVKNPRLRISEIDILCEAEKKQLLFSFNDTGKQYPGGETIAGMFTKQAARIPDRIAVVLNPGNAVGSRNILALSYRKLSEKIDHLAGFLIKKGIIPGDIVGIMVERSLEMAAGIFAILRAGGVYLPIDPAYPEERKNYILRDSNAKIVLTAADLCHTEAGGEPAVYPFEYAAVDTAYILYTSGSTGRPKGVVVRQSAVVNIIAALQNEYPLGETDTYLLKTSYVFDVSVAELFGWFPGGGRLAILGKDLEKNPAGIIDVIQWAAVTHINFVPAMFGFFIEHLNSRNISNLSCLKYIFVAGEELLPGLVEKFRGWHTKIDLENIYGPTEGTVYACKYSLSGWPGAGSIPIGKPLQNIRLDILDRDGHLQPIGVPGELCISGAGLAAGYLDNPESTAEKFVSGGQGGTFRENHPPAPPTKALVKSFLGVQGAIFQKSPLEQNLYKTGDMARRLPDGNIEYLGRFDRQVKIRGFRIELGEIENSLLNHPQVKETVVTVRDDAGGDKYLCAYIIPRAFAIAPQDLREFLTRTLPDYMIPAYFVFIEEMPLTATGKIDRSVLPEPEQKTLRRHTPPGSRLEKKLAEIWSEVLRGSSSSLLPHTPAAGIDDHFFESGGHSLKATRLLTKIHREFDVVIQLPEFFKTPTIRWLSAHITAAKLDKFVSIRAGEKKEYYPLSPAQKRFFFFQQLEPASISYNMNEAMLMTGELAEDKFTRIFQKLIHRHESLRTSFTLTAGLPVQRVLDAPAVDFAIAYHETNNANQAAVAGSQAQAVEDFIRPFDLSEAPLLRVGLLELEKERHILVVDMHHIISDGTSTGIFIGDFLSLYNEEEPPVLRLQYRDYVRWLENRKSKTLAVPGRKNESQTMDRELLELPTDYPRLAAQSFSGAAIKFSIGAQETAGLNRLSLIEETTLFMALFAIFNIFLARLSGQESIVVGSPTAGRLHDDLEGVMGLFINTIAIRSYPAAGKRFTQFLGEVRQNSLLAFEEQERQYEELIEQLEAARDSGRNPLFDVMFVLQNMELPELQIPGLKIKRDVQVDRSAKFDMTLYCEEAPGELQFKLEYCTRLFKHETAARFTRYFKEIAAAVVLNPEAEIGAIEFIDAAERHEILYDFNDTAAPFPAEKTIYRLFEEQAARTPANTALVQYSGRTRTGSVPGTQAGAGLGILGEQYISIDYAGAGRIESTYSLLNETANRLARLLRARGAAANSVIGIMLERSIDLIVGLYAVLKSGAAYLPVDPEYPEKRILAMLLDSRAIMLLSNKKAVARKNLAGISQQVALLDDLAPQLADRSSDNLEPLSRPDDLLYVIFTSGSTGTPKGAGVYQRGFVNLLNWFVNDFALDETDSNLLLTSASFDLTQKNFYASLLLGGKLCLPAFNYFDPGEILHEIEESKASWINCTPSMFFQLIEFCRSDELKKLQSLRYVFLGGEPISLSMYLKWLESEYCRGEIVNTYGPTECTDICNSYRIKDFRRFLAEAVPLGKPIYNVSLYVVDRKLRLLPVGITGELLIAGAGVGCGYVNDREATQQKFVRLSFEKGAPELLLYRTGDLVKWQADGNMVFIGRLDFQVKIRGFRIEIGEIEKRLLEHSRIKEAVVIDRLDSAGEKYLCAYIVSGGKEEQGHSRNDRERRIMSPGRSSMEELTGRELREYLSRSLPGYMIPSYFVFLEKLPLNPNGKVDRQELPLPGIETAGTYTAPRSELEDRLAGIWSGILGIDRGRIGIDDNFFELGGHSLKAAELTARVHQELHVEIGLKEIFRISTIRELARYISREGKAGYWTIGLVEKKEYYVLSSVQKRMYILQQADEQGIVYNIPEIMLLTGKIDTARLRSTFLRLIERHESLRTSFRIVQGQPVQQVSEAAAIEFKIANGENFVRPFDLSSPPLLRVGLSNVEADKNLLSVDMHHIVTDGTSMGILIKEFMALYAGQELAPMRLQYRDFAEWQERNKESDAMKKQEVYWLEQLQGEVPALRLPGDFARPGQRNFAGAAVEFEIGPETLAQLTALAAEESVTLFMALLALFNIMLSKLCCREDIVIGIPVEGRSRADLRQAIGMFVNTLVFRNYPRGGKTFKEFLQEIKQGALAAFENQDYPFDELVSRLDNPLVDVMFTLQNMDVPELEIPGLKSMSYGYKQRTAKFDLSLNGVEKEDRLFFTYEYSTGLFKEETIRRYVEYFQEMIAAVLADRDTPLAKIQVTHDLVDSESHIYRDAAGDFGFQDTRGE